MCNAASEGSFVQKTIAVFSPRFARCLSIQFCNIYFGFGKPFNFGLSHIKLYHFIPLLVPSKFSSAILPQNFLGSRTDLL
jgi:hypothetical protein